MVGHPLDFLFNPRSIAIIGASETPGKAAERRTRSLIEGGYEGRIFPVNPRRRSIFSIRAYPSVLDIEVELDLCVVIVPPQFVLEAVEQSVQRGAKGVIIITAGLGETGPEGKRTEARILDAASRTGARIIGPNCSGIFSASSSLNLLGIPGLRRGPYAVVAQSGNVIDSLSQYARIRDGGFSRIISIGNAIGVKLSEYLDYLSNDPDTEVILLYLEAIGGGRAFLEAASAATTRKPIIAIKAGGTRAGARAAMSHTGSLAANDAVVDACFRQAGILRVHNVDELLDMAEALRCPYRPAGPKVAILSEGGGDNAIAADNAERHGLEVPVLGQQTQGLIRPHLLKGMPASNPIDYGGTAEEDPRVIASCCEACLRSNEVDSVFITGFFGGFREIIAPHVGPKEEETASILVSLMHKYRKPVFIHSSFARQPSETMRILREGRIPVLESSERAMKGLAALYRLSRSR
jgi:acetyltransferase